MNEMNIDHRLPDPNVFLKSIFRYPIKGLSPQGLTSVLLDADMPVPNDRIFALTRPGSGMQTATPQWAQKSKFLMLMMDAPLAQLQTNYDVTTGALTVFDRTEKVFEGSLDEPNSRDEFARVIYNFLEMDSTEIPKLFSTDLPGPIHFMDKPDNVVSLINLETVRAISRDLNRDIDPMRFRANLYVDGMTPWDEFNLVGSKIQIGNVIFKVDRRNTRCAATSVNPKTAIRDLNIPKELLRLYGHRDVGVYLKVVQGGQLNCDDAVQTN